MPLMVVQLCNACGRLLSDEPPLEVETFVACRHCAVVHRKTKTGLARVALADLDPEIAAIAREVIAHYWSQRIVVAAAYRHAA
jgi:hypothetical protein